MRILIDRVILFISIFNFVMPQTTLAFYGYDNFHLKINGHFTEGTLFSIPEEYLVKDQRSPQYVNITGGVNLGLSMNNWLGHGQWMGAGAHRNYYLPVNVHRLGPNCPPWMMPRCNLGQNCYVPINRMSSQRGGVFRAIHGISSWTGGGRDRFSSRGGGSSRFDDDEEERPRKKKKREKKKKTKKQNRQNKKTHKKEKVKKKEQKEKKESIPPKVTEPNKELLGRIDKLITQLENLETENRKLKEEQNKLKERLKELKRRPDVNITIINKISNEVVNFHNEVTNNNVVSNTATNNTNTTNTTEVVQPNPIDTNPDRDVPKVAEDPLAANEKDDKADQQEVAKNKEKKPKQETRNNKKKEKNIEDVKEEVGKKEKKAKKEKEKTELAKMCELLESGDFKTEAGASCVDCKTDAYRDMVDRLKNVLAFEWITGNSEEEKARKSCEQLRLERKMPTAKNYSAFIKRFNKSCPVDFKTFYKAMKKKAKAESIPVEYLLGMIMAESDTVINGHGPCSVKGDQTYLLVDKEATETKCVAEPVVKNLCKKTEYKINSYCLNIAQSYKAGKCLIEKYQSVGLFQINLKYFGKHAKAKNNGKYLDETCTPKDLKNKTADQLAKSHKNCVFNPYANMDMALYVLKRKYKAVNLSKPNSVKNIYPMDAKKKDKTGYPSIVTLRSNTSEGKKARDLWRKAFSAYNGGEGHVYKTYEDLEQYNIKRELKLDVNNYNDRKLLMFRHFLDPDVLTMYEINKDTGSLLTKADKNGNKSKVWVKGKKDKYHLVKLGEKSGDGQTYVFNNGAIIDSASKKPIEAYVKKGSNYKRTRKLVYGRHRAHTLTNVFYVDYIMGAEGADSRGTKVPESFPDGVALWWKSENDNLTNMFKSLQLGDPRE